MQQQQSPTVNPSAQFSPTAITTEQIQKCLDDNKNLILAILENQNLGKLNECAQYQARLQKNLMYLAAIADAQPQPSNSSQVPQNSAPQQASNFMQQPQVATPQQQQGGGGPKLPFQLNALRGQDQQQQQHLLQFQQLQQQQQQQQQQMQGQMGLRPGAQNAMLGMHQAMQSGLGQHGGMMDMRGSKQDGADAASSGDGHGKSASGRSSGNRDS